MQSWRWLPRIVCCHHPGLGIPLTSRAVLFGAFMNSGQICMSTERILVGRDRYDDLVKALQLAWKTRPPTRGRRLFSLAHEGGVRTLVQDAKQHGAVNVLQTDDQPAGVKGHTHGEEIAPMILGPATPEMRIYIQETFAPIAIIIPVDRSGNDLVDNMVDISNASEYGLTASVWGADLTRATAVAKRLEAGAVHINTPASAICRSRNEADVSGRPSWIHHWSHMEAGRNRVLGDSMA